MALIKAKIDGFKQRIFPPMEELSLGGRFDLADLTMTVFFSERLFAYLLSGKLVGSGSAPLIAALGILYVAILCQRIRRKDSSAFFLFALALLVTLTLAFIAVLFTPDLKFWLFGSESGLLIKLLDLRNGISGLLLILLVKDPRKILRNVFVSSLLYFVYLCYQAFLFAARGSWSSYFTLAVGTTRYNMNFGFKMIFVVVVFLAVALMKKSFSLLALAAAAFCLALSYGSRSVLLAALAFGILFTIYLVPPSWRITRASLAAKLKAASIVLLVLVTGFFLVGAMPAVEKTVYSAAAPLRTDDSFLPGEEDTSDLGTGDPFSSRTVDSILGGGFLADNGRFKIWRPTLEAFLKRPLTGLGLFGDRLVVGREFLWGYAHNIVLEFMVQFGIWGLLLLAILIRAVVRILARREDIHMSLLVVIMSSMCAILLVSDSYLFNTFFWSLLGLVLVHYRVHERLASKRKAVLPALLVLCLATSALFLIRDYRNQTFRTVVFDRPSVLLTVTDGRTGPGDLEEMISRHGLAASVFVSGSPVDKLVFEEAAVDSQAYRELEEAGWTFENGGYSRENPYYLSAIQQETDLERTRLLFDKLGLAQPRAFAPLWGTVNATIQFRLMKSHAFIQGELRSGLARPLTRLTDLGRLSVPAVRLYWEDEAGKAALFRYLDQVAKKGALAVLSIKSQEYEAGQVDEVLDYLKEGDFDFLTYEDLASRALDHQGRLGLKNYLENLYLLGRIEALLNKR